MRGQLKHALQDARRLIRRKNAHGEDFTPSSCYPTFRWTRQWPPIRAC